MTTIAYPALSHSTARRSGTSLG